MKKFLLVCMSVFMTAGLFQANAQTLSGGIKAEANMSNFLLSSLDNQKSTMKVGASLGGFMKIDLHENFAIQPEMMFFYRASEMKTLGLKDDFQQFGVQVPIYAVGQMNMGTGKGYIGIGPYVGFGFDAKYDKADFDLYKKRDGKRAMQRWDFGASAMVGYEFSNRMQINATYQIGLIDQLDENKKDGSMKNQAVSLGLAYRF